MVRDIIKFENATIIFRNFKGKEGKFNREGDKNFCVLIEDPDIAGRLIEDGWNVKALRPREDDPDDSPRYYLPVAVSYRNIPPKIFVVRGNKQILMNDNTVEELDYAMITNVDLAVRPYNYDVNGKTGVKAYVKTMYVTVEEDEFADKYAMFESPTEEYEEDDLPF